MIFNLWLQWTATNYNVKIDCLTKSSNLSIAHQTVEVKRPSDQVQEAPLFLD